MCNLITHISVPMSHDNSINSFNENKKLAWNENKNLIYDVGMVVHS